MSEVIDEATLFRLQKLAAVGEVSAGVSHETRNLLTAIVGFTQLASQRAKSLETAMHYLGLVEREAKRCIEVLQQQLDLSKDSTAASDVAAIAREVATAASYQIELKRVALELDVVAMPAVTVRRNHLQQVLLNLLINALHATPPGGSITVSARQIGATVELAVTDSGPGVPAEIRPAIFEAFFTTKGDGGTGLGLAVSRRVLAGYGAMIDLDHTYERGARFVVTLPVAA